LEEKLAELRARNSLKKELVKEEEQQQVIHEGKK
jgi:hypothetical protein